MGYSKPNPWGKMISSRLCDYTLITVRMQFQKIYAISMPHRVDKKDTLALMALVSDLDIEFIDGVNGSSIHPSAMPPVRIYYSSKSLI
jgi:hypothetical protein